MKRLKVIALQRGRDVETLEPNYMVAFGKYMAVTDEMRTRAKSLGVTLPEGPEVGANILVLFLPGESPPPYRLGSEWELDVEPGGAIRLKEVQK